MEFGKGQFFEITLFKATIYNIFNKNEILIVLNHLDRKKKHYIPNFCDCHFSD